MAQSFVPVDLDKLLDEFEEQESPRSSAPASEGVVQSKVAPVTPNGNDKHLSTCPRVPGLDYKTEQEGSTSKRETRLCSTLSGIGSDEVNRTALGRDKSVQVSKRPSGEDVFLEREITSELRNNATLSKAEDGKRLVECLKEDVIPDNSLVGQGKSQLKDNGLVPKQWQRYDDLSSSKRTLVLHSKLDSSGNDNEICDTDVFSDDLNFSNTDLLQDNKNRNMSHHSSSFNQFAGNEEDKAKLTSSNSDSYGENSDEFSRMNGPNANIVGENALSLCNLNEDCSGKIEQDAYTARTSNDVICTENSGDRTTYTAAATDTDSSLFFLRDHFRHLTLNEGQIVTPGPDSQDGLASCSSANQINISDLANSDEQSGGQFIGAGEDALTEEPSILRNNSDSVRCGDSLQLGYSQPQWMPDNETGRCMNCHSKFTVVRRRHHCRACGKVFCSSCCNLKFNLRYLGDKLARVCQTCANTLLQRQATLSSPDVHSGNDDPGMYLYPSMGPREYGDFPESQANTVNEGEEIQDDNSFYYDNVPDEISSIPSNANQRFRENVGSPTEDSTQSSAQFRSTICSSSSSMSSIDTPVSSTIPLPPILRKTEDGLKIDNAPNHSEILYLLKKKKETATFLLNKNLIVRVKIVKLKCCVKRKCWCFSSEGMGAADQEDMVILLECLPKESCVPQDVLSHFNTAFAYAKQGHRVTDLGYTIFGQPFLGSLRNAGFLYIKSSFQCVENLILPSGPHIFGILIQREEVSWVQLFPIRLILRLGAEYRYYPCPLWSVRDRDALYGEIGHTIMDLLADFKNFQYTLPRVTGMYVHLEEKRTVIQLPQNRYDEVVKVLNATDEYVMAFEATFSNVADSHLVCIQDGTGYKTQAINIEGQERKVTAASFVVFNGALKTTTDMKAKVSIVEDGVMVQMVMQISQEMRQAMREMRDFTINTGNVSDEVTVQEVVLEWITKGNSDIETFFSPIDGIPLGDTTDIKINTHFDYSTPSIYRLCWSQLFFFDETEERQRNLSSQFKQSAADIAKGCTVALRPYLGSLSEYGKSLIGLRVNLNPDTVGYTIGSQGTSLPDEMVTKLDNELVPAINNAVNPSNSEPTSMEFLFNIIEVLS